MNIKLVFLSFLSVSLFACATAPQESEPMIEQEQVSTAAQPAQKSEADVSMEKAAAPDDPFYILMNIPYSANATVAENVMRECTMLGPQLSASVVKFAPRYNIDVVQVEGSLPDTGRTVVLEIQNVYSGGNAWIGHRKSATVNAQLLVDGKTMGTTSKTRNSGGGFWGGFKGSCDVLVRVVDALGRDIGEWLSTQ